MVMTRTPSQRYRYKIPNIWSYVLAVVLLLFSVVYFTVIGLFVEKIYMKYVPNMEKVEVDFSGLTQPIFYKGELTGDSAIGQNVGLKLPLSFIQKHIDSAMIYEESSSSIIITTSDKVIRMKSEQLTAMMNEKPLVLKFAVERVADQIYVPVASLLELYQIHLEQSSVSGAVIFHKAGDAIQWGSTVPLSLYPEKSILMRQKQGFKSPILKEMEKGEKLMIWGEDSGWYRVQDSDGIGGYVRKTQLELDYIEVKPNILFEPAYIPWKPNGGKINISWEQVERVNPDTSKFGAMPGLNVVSPTWFHLADGDGNLRSVASAAYVTWAHQQGYQVWGLFSNSFNLEWTNQALSTYDKRMKMIKQLLAYSQMYKLQGINIDFENVYLKDKDKFTQFIREMVPLLHEQGLVVSIDVTIKSTNPTWSMFYDRRAIGQVVDYMMVMTYDEHWASSPKAGSVASLPWVERGIVQIMREDGVPASKLLVGVPFYTRIWTEEWIDGKIKVSSRAVFMGTVQGIIKDKNLTPVFLPEAGQHYVEYKEGNKTMKIWIEDEVSMKARAELVRKYDFAGIASWRRGYETPGIWDVINNELTKRP